MVYASTIVEGRKFLYVIKYVKYPKLSFRYNILTGDTNLSVSPIVSLSPWKSDNFYISFSKFYIFDIFFFSILSANDGHLVQ